MTIKEYFEFVSKNKDLTKEQIEELRSQLEIPFSWYHEHDFWHTMPEDCKKAISELKRMKVFRCCAFDYEETFADVWWAVLHEVDMYVEGEFCREASRSCYGEGDPEAMNYRQALTADKWLIRWNDLAIKYSLPGSFSEYHDQCVGRFGEDGVGTYGGQL